MFIYNKFQHFHRGFIFIVVNEIPDDGKCLAHGDTKFILILNKFNKSKSVGAPFFLNRFIAKIYRFHSIQKVIRFE